ncbi:hypothetical protein F4V57_04270 [Acinetobacter qingfengensis]|uniref:Uncharacterized protein n=1 Tax=Acinetobacter qingfengensis TaxID=1262585 RepID=A0A1E7RCR3_9GAMM|nr:hypothetical protein [Acinetobacter qingfengensis]KAA8734979.1 hypothetical protein F4V57_04270 [Acinetobacter qingfengensis]OEY97066.1 hypothetical protein BJI46_11075 [Acinetobacter qingfengensis]
MHQRTQLILQQLGIQQWIDRQTPTIQHRTDILWRDHLVEPKSASILQKPHSITQADQTSETLVKEKISPKIDDVVVIEDFSVITDRVSKDAVAILPLQQNIYFDYQLMVHDQILLLAQINNQQEMQLFQGIVQACFATQQQLKWPLMIENWEMHDQLVETYLQGYFFEHQQKILIMLGEIQLPLQNLQFKQFHITQSLQQMLDSADYKRSLWQLIYPYIYDIESVDEKESRHIQ